MYIIIKLEYVFKLPFNYIQILKQLKQIAPTTYVKIPQEYKDVQDIRNKLILDSILSNRYTW